MPRLQESTRTVLRVLLPLALVAILVIKFYGDFHHDPEDSIACEFSRSAGARELAAPNGNRPIGKLRIEARLHPNSDANFFDVSGTANWPSKDEQASAEVGGVVWLAGKRKIDGLMLNVNYPGFKGEDLRISTLNGDGQLDRDSKKAFLHFGREDRLDFPVSYACRIDHRAAHWGWS